MFLLEDIEYHGNNLATQVDDSGYRIPQDLAEKSPDPTEKH
jgi:hypothetical protein